MKANAFQVHEEMKSFGMRKKVITSECFYFA